MNRFLKSLLLALSFTLLISTVALAATWDFKYPTTATDNTSTTRTYYPVILGYGGQQLIDNEKILSSGLNTNMQIGSTDVDYMMSTTNVAAIVPTLPSNGSVTLDLYTGYSPLQTGFPIVIGDGGYITVSDHASMEMGDNFTLTISGAILNTDNGSDKNIWYKEDAIELYVDASTSGKVNLIVKGTPGTETLRPNGAGYTTGISYANPAVAHYLNVDDTGSGDADSTYVYPYKFGTGEQYDAYELTDTALTSSAYITSIQVVQRVRDTQDVASTTHTGLRLNSTNVLSSAHDPSGTSYNAFTDTIARPGGGDWSVSDLNSLQVLLGIDAPYDWDTFCTQTYVIVNYRPLTTISIPDIELGVYDITLSADGTNLTLDVGGTSNSTTLSAGVANNANDITIMQGNSFVKADSIELEIDGVPVATYAPTEMLTGSTLTDETGSNDGTITWGSNTGVEINYGAMEASIESEGGSAVTGNATLPTAFMPATWFAMGENIENLPFYDMIYSAVSSMDFPDVTEGVQTIYLIVIYGTSLMAFLLIVLFTRSALLGFSAMEIVLFVGSSMTIIPMWIPVAILLVGIGIMFLYRQVSY